MPQPTDNPQPLGSSVPPEDQWFQLEVDYDVNVMKHISSAPLDGSSWINQSVRHYAQPPLSGRVLSRIKLVSLGQIDSVEEAKRLIREKYSCRCLHAEGLPPFRNTFPRHNGRPIAFGGSYWGKPGLTDRHHIAYLLPVDDGGWRATFREAYFEGFSAEWQWAIVL